MYVLMSIVAAELNVHSSAVLFGYCQQLFLNKAWPYVINHQPPSTATIHHSPPCEAMRHHLLMVPGHGWSFAGHPTVMGCWTVR